MKQDVSKARKEAIILLYEHKFTYRMIATLLDVSVPYVTKVIRKWRDENEEE